MGCCINFVCVALLVQLFFCLLPVYCCIFYLNMVFTLVMVCVYLIDVEIRLPNLLFFRKHLFFILCVYSLCTTCVPGHHGGQKRTLDPPETGVLNCCVPPCGSWV